MIITSDRGGFAGVPPSTIHPPPADIRSQELSNWRNALLRQASRSSELAASSGRIPSAGGQHPKRRSPPITAASPEYSRTQFILLRPAFAHRS